MNGSLEDLGNPELLAATHLLVRRGREVEADLLRHLGEVDARRLYLEEACSSMFVYCVRRVPAHAPGGNATLAPFPVCAEIPVLNENEMTEANAADKAGLGTAPALASNQAEQASGLGLPPLSALPMGLI